MAMVLELKLTSRENLFPLHPVDLHPELPLVATIAATEDHHSQHYLVAFPHLSSRPVISGNVCQLPVESAGEFTLIGEESVSDRDKIVLLYAGRQGLLTEFFQEVSCYTGTQMDIIMRHQWGKVAKPNRGGSYGNYVPQNGTRDLLRSFTIDSIRPGTEECVQYIAEELTRIHEDIRARYAAARND